MNIGTVVEGPTDRLVLEAVLSEIIPGEHRYFPLQPSTPLGATGTGWKGVRRWCQETWQRQGSSLDQIISGETGAPLDLLVIHIDADFAAEDDLQDDDAPVADVQQPCPPAAATADKLRQVVAHWLGQEDLPLPVVLAIPAQDTETWVFAALYPDDELCSREDYECLHAGRDHPAYRLTLGEYGKYLRRTSGRIRKSVPSYREIAPQVAASWKTVRRICPQAERFDNEILTVRAIELL